MIYRVRFSPEFIVQYLVTGAAIRPTRVIDGLPEGFRLFSVIPNRHGDWEALFEGPHDGKTEGVLEEKKIVFQSLDSLYDKPPEDAA